MRQPQHIGERPPGPILSGEPIAASWLNRIVESVSRIIMQRLNALHWKWGYNGPFEIAVIDETTIWIRAGWCYAGLADGTTGSGVAFAATDIDFTAEAAGTYYVSISGRNQAGNLIVSSGTTTPAGTKPSQTASIATTIIGRVVWDGTRITAVYQDHWGYIYWPRYGPTTSYVVSWELPFTP